MIKLNTEAYKKLVEGDIEWLDKIHPNNSPEKSHIKQVLMDSIVEDEPEEIGFQGIIDGGCSKPEVTAGFVKCDGDCFNCGYFRRANK